MLHIMSSSDTLQYYSSPAESSMAASSTSQNFLLDHRTAVLMARKLQELRDKGNEDPVRQNGMTRYTAQGRNRHSVAFFGRTNNYEFNEFKKQVVEHDTWNQPNSGGLHRILVDHGCEASEVVHLLYHPSMSKLCEIGVPFRIFAAILDPEAEHYRYGYFHLCNGRSLLGPPAVHAPNSHLQFTIIDTGSADDWNVVEDPPDWAIRHINSLVFLRCRPPPDLALFKFRSLTRLAISLRPDFRQYPTGLITLEYLNTFISSCQLEMMVVLSPDKSPQDAEMVNQLLEWHTFENRVIKICHASRPPLPLWWSSTEYATEWLNRETVDTFWGAAEKYTDRAARDVLQRLVFNETMSGPFQRFITYFTHPKYAPYTYFNQPTQQDPVAGYVKHLTIHPSLDHIPLNNVLSRFPALEGLTISARRFSETINSPTALNLSGTQITILNSGLIEWRPTRTLASITHLYFHHPPAASVPWSSLPNLTHLALEIEERDPAAFHTHFRDSGGIQERLVELGATDEKGESSLACLAFCVSANEDSVVADWERLLRCVAQEEKGWGRRLCLVVKERMVAEMSRRKTAWRGEVWDFARRVLEW